MTSRVGVLPVGLVWPVGWVYDKSDGFVASRVGV